MPNDKPGNKPTGPAAKDVKAAAPKVTGKGGYLPPENAPADDQGKSDQAAGDRLAEVQAELAKVRKSMVALSNRRRALETEAAKLLADASLARKLAKLSPTEQRALANAAKAADAEAK